MYVLLVCKLSFRCFDWLPGCQTLERLAFIEKSKTYILELRCFEVMQPTLFLQNF